MTISGSLDPASANSALLRQFAEASSSHDVVPFERLGDLPPFRPGDGPAGDAVDELRAAAAAADGVVIATPEYAGGMPGSLKNALDWLVGTGELYGKRVVVLSVAPSADRGAGARSWLEQTLRMQGATVVESSSVARTEAAGPAGAAVIERVRRALETGAPG